MFEYIVARLSSAPVIEESRRGLHFQEKIGSFLDLHCGHNVRLSVVVKIALGFCMNLTLYFIFQNQFTADEKIRLAAILRETVGA
jgi:hypothetical protein